MEEPPCLWYCARSTRSSNKRVHCRVGIQTYIPSHSAHSIIDKPYDSDRSRIYLYILEFSVRPYWNRFWWLSHCRNADWTSVTLSAWFWSTMYIFHIFEFPHPSSVIHAGAVPPDCCQHRRNPSTIHHIKSRRILVDTYVFRIYPSD